MSEFSKGHCSLQTVYKIQGQILTQAFTGCSHHSFSWFEGDCSSFVWWLERSLLWPWTLSPCWHPPALEQHMAFSLPVCSDTARFELWVSFPSCTACAAKFVMSFSGMLQEHSAFLLLFLLCFDYFFMSQKFYTSKPQITKMLSGITVLCLAKNENTASSECCFRMFIRDMVQIFSSQFNCSSDLVWLLSYLLLFSRVFHTDATIHPVFLYAENIICGRIFVIVSLPRKPLIYLLFFIIVIQLFLLNRCNNRTDSAVTGLHKFD